MSSRKALLVAAFLTASANAVLAQTSTSSLAATGTPAAQRMPTGSMPGSSGDMPMTGDRQMGAMPMMRMMQMMVSMADHVEGRIAFLKTELKITDGSSRCGMRLAMRCGRAQRTWPL